MRIDVCTDLLAAYLVKYGYKFLGQRNKKSWQVQRASRDPTAIDLCRKVLENCRRVSLVAWSSKNVCDHCGIGALTNCRTIRSRKKAVTFVVEHDCFGTWLQGLLVPFFDRLDLQSVLQLQSVFKSRLQPWCHCTKLVPRNSWRTISIMFVHFSLDECLWTEIRFNQINTETRTEAPQPIHQSGQLMMDAPNTPVWGEIRQDYQTQLVYGFHRSYSTVWWREDLIHRERRSKNLSACEFACKFNPSLLLASPTFGSCLRGVFCSASCVNGAFVAVTNWKKKQKTFGWLFSWGWVNLSSRWLIFCFCEKETN